MLRSQLLPRLGRVGDVLDSANTPGLVFGPEVERTEVDAVVGLLVDAMERDAEEALLLDVLALEIDLNRAVGELDVSQVGRSGAHPFSRLR
jgi:hypothetical protein